MVHPGTSWGPRGVWREPIELRGRRTVCVCVCGRVARLRAPISALSPRREDYFLLPFHIQSLRSEVEGGLLQVQ